MLVGMLRDFVEQTVGECGKHDARRYLFSVWCGILFHFFLFLK